ncbi:hypothetical protein DESC_800043 [Desulfosarcina cetonica]|nr:hypothetical protein DESC_800043 [Desulfosarcina cetonica]
MLTVPLVRKILSLILPLRSLSVEGMKEIIQYHLRRNFIAYISHRKKRVRLAKSYNIYVSL